MSLTTTTSAPGARRATPALAVLTSLATIVAILVTAATSSAGASTVPAVGYDVSYPQCPALATATLPFPAPFTIIGVNDGLAYSTNPCLAQLYRWAAGAGVTEPNGPDSEPDIALYANTGNPGPQRSARWPKGQAFPRFCDGSWNTACSYDYGWNAAGDAFTVADAALPNGVAADATWWLDVETANSWNPTDPGTNIAALEGFFDRLTVEAPGQVVGFYSTQHQWGLITGATNPNSGLNAPFADAPNWVAGATAATARSFCGDTFTGGPVEMVQYVEGGIDHDVRC